MSRTLPKHLLAFLSNLGRPSTRDLRRSGHDGPRDLTEHQKHYLAMLGTCCEDARLAGMPVSLELDDGRLVEGVPSSSPTGPNDQEIDHTGVNPYLELDGELVMLEHVRGYRVSRP